MMLMLNQCSVKHDAAGPENRAGKAITYGPLARPHHEDEAIAWYHGGEGRILVDGSPSLAVG